MAAPESDGVRPWADIPVEMVDAIVQNLDVFSTTRLASVCTAWCAAVATNTALPFGAPCLLTTTEDVEYYSTSDDPKDWGYQLQDLTSLTTDSRVLFSALIPPLQDVREQWWVGGKDDWLAVVDECGGAGLLNPYTGRQIDLPRIAAPVDPCVFKTARGTFDRIVVCATPSDDEGYLVIGIVNDYKLLAVTKGGDKSWTVLRNPSDSFYYKDAVMHKGKVFAVVDRAGSVYVWDIQGGGCPDPEKIQPPNVDRGENQDLESWKLAESADGLRLLIICTYGGMVECFRKLPYGRYESCLGFKAEGVRVYERDVDDGDGGWSPVTSLGNIALFLGLNYPFFARIGKQGTSDSDSERHFVRPNCICFAKGNYYLRDDYDVGVFYLGSDDVYPYMMDAPKAEYYRYYQEPIWFRPRLKNYDLEQVAEDST